MNPLSIAPAAIQRLLELQKKSNVILRIRIESGGCSGLKVHFSLESNSLPCSDDMIFEQDGAFIMVDSISIPYLQNTTLDYNQDLMSSAFILHAPQATSRCGCGSSFSFF